MTLVSLGKHTVTRNTLLLSGGMAALYAMNQLAIAIATITFAAVTGLEGLAGLGPAIFLAARRSPLLRRDELWIASAGFPCSR
jgi:hypothetical protein